MLSLYLLRKYAFNIPFESTWNKQQYSTKITQRGKKGGEVMSSNTYNFVPLFCGFDLKSPF